MHENTQDSNSLDLSLFNHYSVAPYNTSMETDTPVKGKVVDKILLK